MEGIHLACTSVQYRAAVNCELFNTLIVEKTENFLICRLLKTHTHIFTHVTYRSEQYRLHSKWSTVKNFQHALLSIQVHDTAMFNWK